MKKNLLIALFIIYGCLCYSQRETIDSLLNLIGTDKADTNKVKHLNQLAFEFAGNYSKDSSLFYTNEGMKLLEAPLLQKFDKKVINRLKADLFRSIAWAYGSAGDFSKALEHDLISLKIELDNGHKKGAGQSYNQVGIDYINLDNYTKAVDYFLKDLELQEELGDKKEMIMCCNHLGLVYSHLSNRPKAEEYYLKAVKINEETGDKKGMADYYYSIALVYGVGENADYPKSLENHLKALKIYREIVDKRGIANSFRNIANDYYYSGVNYSKALEYYLKYIKAGEEFINKTEMALCYGFMAEIYTHQANYTQAQEYLIKALKIFEEKKQGKFIEMYNKEMGNCYKELKDYPKALESYLKAVNNSEKEKDNIDGGLNSYKYLSLGSYYNSIGDLYKIQGQNEDALKYFLKALKVEEMNQKVLISEIEPGQNASIYRLALCNINLGDVYNKLNNKLALQYLSSGLKMAREEGDISLQKDALFYLASYYSKTNNKKEAEESTSLYKILSDSVLRVDERKKVGALKVKLEMEKKEAEFYAGDKNETEKSKALSDEKERRRKIMLTSIIGGFIVLVFLLIFVFKKKN